MKPNPKSQPSPRLPLDRLLAADHQRLDRSFEALVARAQGGDPIQLRSEWQTFELGLLDHLELEEREILPGFAREAPADARAILDEHTAIRTALFELGVNLDLHLLRADVVRSFCDRLRAHAEREEAALYRWAARHVPPSEWEKLGRRLGGASGGGHAG